SLAVTKAADVKEQAADAREAGLEKMGGLLDDFNAALPVLRKAGFTVKGVNIELGVPPKVVAEFYCAADITEEEVDTLTQENADRKFTVLLLRSLLQAWKLHSKFHIAGMRVNELAVVIGLLPLVTLKFE